MRKFLMITTALVFLQIPANAQAGNNDGGGLTEAIGNVIDDVVEVFTGENDENDTNSNESSGETGRENALNQIDKNIDKHGGSHHGLENARRAVSKTKQKYVNDIDGDGDTEELIDVIIEELGDGVKEELGVDTPESTAKGNHPKWKEHKGHPGKGKGSMNN